MDELPPGTPEPERRVVIRVPAESAPTGEPDAGSGGSGGSGGSAAAAPEVPGRDRTGPEIRIGWGPILAGAGGAMAAFSLLLPWWNLSYHGIQLLDGTVSWMEGWPALVSVGAGWVLLLALAFDAWRPGSSLVPVVGLAAALVLLLAAGAALLMPGASIGAGSSLSVRAGPGAWLALAGGAAAVFGYGLLFAERR